MSSKGMKQKDSFGRGGKRGPVRIRVARVIPDQETILKHQRSNGGLYEDMMLFVKDQMVTTRKRGRPRKSNQTSGHLDNLSKIIYVPSLKHGSGRYLPMVTNPYNQMQENSTINRTQVRNTVKCIIHPTVLQSLTKPLVEDGKMKWPDDLKWLVAAWDTLPESNMREVVKWLLTPLYPTNYPQIVVDIHSLIEEWTGSTNDKVIQMEAILQDSASQESEPLLVIPPKVVVEAQPNPLQHCCQWSSMADNQENREP